MVAMTDHEEVELGAQCVALEDAAHPGLYRRNAFRVSGVNVEATSRDISRQVEKLQLMQKYGTNGVARSPLAIEPPPDEHAVRTALHDLNDPERRLIDEFFWFWPLQMGQAKTDRALSLLAAGDIAGASNAWTEAEQSSEAYVSTHNLAVLHHCLALDLEAEAASRSLSAEEKVNLDKYWDATSRRWQALIGHEAFWSRLSNRIRILEDPRLTTGLARRIRQALPKALLAVNAVLAVRAAESGDFVTAKRHVETMNRLEGAGATRASADGCKKVLPASGQALKQALAPLRKRIRSACEDFESKADADPLQGDKITRELVEYARPLLKVFDDLLGSGDATRDAVRDEVAIIALRCQIPYGNKSENWRESLKLLELIEPLAAGQAAKERIAQNIKTVRANVKLGCCWFCDDNDASPQAVYRVDMHGDVTRTRTYNGTQLRWRQMSVEVPRCDRCMNVHDNESLRSRVGAVIGGVVGIGLWIAVDAFPGVFIAAGCAFAGFKLGAQLDKPHKDPRVKPRSHGDAHPRVLMLFAMGWRHGSRPVA